MKRRFLLIIAALGCAMQAWSNTRQLQHDTFDEALLRVDEAVYLGETIPDVAVVTESGTTKLSEIIAARPSILVLAYYTCGHACPMTIQNLARALSDVRSPSHQIIVLSFDAGDTLETMHHAKSTLVQVPPNWTFGLLEEQDVLHLTGALGYKFFFSERDQIFVHPTVLVFLSPDGEVMRYLYGTEPRAKDIELALIESRNRAPRLNEFVDMVKLTCFQFDADRSRYVLHPAVIIGSVGIGILGVTGLVSLTYKPTPKGGP
jgi:protein SCO1/2